MARLTAATLALALGAACALALVACGGSDAKLLPGDTAREITENLDAVQRLAGEGECEAAEDAALQVSAQIDALEGIDPKLKANLQEGAERLNEVIDTCAEETTEETVEEEPETEEEIEKPEKPTPAEKEAEKAQEQEEKAQEHEQKQEEKEAEKTEPPGQTGENPGHGGEPP